MPYDLYGNYYTREIDAFNAEMAQCAAIDADMAYRKISALENKLHKTQQPTPQEEEINQLWQYTKMLEERIVALEKATGEKESDHVG